MIRFFTKSSPARESLVGKFVLHEGSNIFASYANLRMVVSESEKSYVGRELLKKFVDGRIVFTGVSDEDPQGSVYRKASVACICDTIEDVNVVARKNAEAQQLFHDAIADSKVLFEELEGYEAESEPTAETQKGPRP